MKSLNVFLIGPMGAGKSTIGRSLARALQRDFYDSDVVIEEKAGASLSWIYDIEGEKGYRRREAQVVEELTQQTNIVLATGGGVVTAPSNRLILAKRGTVIYLKTSLEQQYKRTRRDSKRPVLQIKNVKAKIDELWNELEPLYRELADVTFDTDSLSVKIVTQQILDYLLSGQLDSAGFDH